MTEPDVALTDFGLALLCSWFSWKRSGWWRAFFISVALASLLGGTVHGFFTDESSLTFRLLWPATLLSIGLTASTAWILAGRYVSGPQRQSPWAILATVSFIVDAAVLIFVSQGFVVAVANYLPAMTALMLAALWTYRRSREASLLWIAAGVLVGFLAAFVQRMGIALDPRHFNHNATYHLVQAAGLVMMFRGAGGDRK